MNPEQSKYIEDLEKCVRCGKCKAVCPTLDDNPVEGSGARGRVALLRAFVSGRIKPSRLLNDRIFSCILCGACSGSCPLGVDIPEAIYLGRALLKRTDRRRSYLRALVKFTTRWPDLAFRLAKLGRSKLFPALAGRGLIPFSPELPDAPLRTAEQVFRTHKKKGRVAVFAGCSVNFVMPHLGESLINVLQKSGYEVVLPKGEVCCGNPLRTLGLEDQAIEQAKKNFRVFSRLKVEAILSPCPTCTLMLKTEYPKMIGKGLDRAMDISVFFSDKIEATDSINKTAYYHDPCHLSYSLGVRKEPRQLIQRAGLRLTGQEDSGCCGFGGLFCLSNKEISQNLLAKKTGNIMGSDADTVITSCPGCILQLSRTIIDRPVLHLVELLEEAYCFRPLEKKEKKGHKETEEEEPTLF